MDASFSFRNIDFLRTSIYDVYEQDNIRTNRALVQSLFRQSATRAREVPSSGKLPFPTRGISRSASKAAGSTADAKLKFKVRFWPQSSLFCPIYGPLTRLEKNVRERSEQVKALPERDQRWTTEVARCKLGMHLAAFVRPLKKMAHSTAR